MENIKILVKFFKNMWGLVTSRHLFKINFRVDWENTMSKKTIILIIFCVVLNVLYIYNRNGEVNIVFSENIELVEFNNNRIEEASSIIQATTTIENTTQESTTQESTIQEDFTQKTTNDENLYTSSDKSSDHPESSKININTASASELDTLPSIGEVLASRIIQYRSEIGMFGSIDEIKNVSGIGDKTFENLKNLIVVE